MDTPPPWSLSKTIAFRFLLIYLPLYVLKGGPVIYVVPAVGNLLGVNAAYRRNGSGDTMFHYVLLLCTVLAAFGGALIWSAVDRKRNQYHRLYLGLRVFIRLYLGMVLIQYGSIKVIQSQFPSPSLYVLEQKIGDSSPMRILWTLMGVSYPYNIFTGGVEMLAGILLFFPRTTLLGSLIALTATVQICALNFCYDVPVKLFSMHLVGMAAFLAAGDLRRLMQVFFLNQTAPPASFETVLKQPVLLRAAFILKTMVLVGLLASMLYGAAIHQRGPQPGVDRSRFLLLNRGFHWVNDVAFNR